PRVDVAPRADLRPAPGPENALVERPAPLHLVGEDRSEVGRGAPRADALGLDAPHGPAHDLLLGGVIAVRIRRWVEFFFRWNSQQELVQPPIGIRATDLEWPAHRVASDLRRIQLSVLDLPHPVAEPAARVLSQSELDVPVGKLRAKRLRHPTGQQEVADALQVAAYPRQQDRLLRADGQQGQQAVEPECLPPRLALAAAAIGPQIPPEVAQAAVAEQRVEHEPTTAHGGVR